MWVNEGMGGKTCQWMHVWVESGVEWSSEKEGVWGGRGGSEESERQTEQINK